MCHKILRKYIFLQSKPNMIKINDSIVTVKLNIVAAAMNVSLLLSIEMFTVLGPSTSTFRAT